MKQVFLDFLKKIPIPICGLILGMVSLGNLLYSKGYPVLGNFFDLAGLFFMTLILMKLIFTMRHLIESLKDPIIGSVSPTFTMAWMVICVFLNRVFPHSPLVYLIWLIAVLLHFVLMAYFIALHIIPQKVGMHHVYPSWFITFVGLGVIPNTATAFNLEIGRIVLWPALLFYFILLPIIGHRIFIFKKMHESTLPLITILTAPGSLCLAAYLTVMDHKSTLFVFSLFVLSQFIYLITVVLIIPLLRLPFYPSYAAFTFPLVISATAVSLLSKNYPDLNFLLTPLATIELFIAFLAVSYVLIRYTYFLCKKA
ncbi:MULTISPECIES: TDT family transporter [Lactococcus]|uniref:TDT family transporter n=1 Tax=Lactococcus TaxID=1357 RepID=UPI000ED5BC10|nr:MULTISPECIES: TDT family transporter [Lactococcus]MBL3715514.1 C4-dicarboxylate ABC transporter [Lactococcus garvieae]HAP15271.1 C4-dicarboxylate ABC transporter [Lactococcus sp.]